jgi:hypothetical protein
MFNGLRESIGNDIPRLAPAIMKITDVAPPERKHAVWVSGSNLWGYAGMIFYSGMFLLNQPAFPTKLSYFPSNRADSLSFVSVK